MHGIALLVCAALAQAPLEPETVELSDHFERIVAHGQSWGLLGLDTCAHAPWQTPLELQIGERHYTKGLGLHANGEIVVDLGGAFTKFEAEVGVQAQGGTVGSVVFELFADDETLRCRELSRDEQQEVLALLVSPRFVNAAPREVYATLLDEGGDAD
jgi:hypothetical protein